MNVDSSSRIFQTSSEKETKESIFNKSIVKKIVKHLRKSLNNTTNLFKPSNKHFSVIEVDSYIYIVFLLFLFFIENSTTTINR